MLPLATVPFYIQGWLPKQGKAMVYGQSKGGKSHSALQLARCLGVGELFIGVPTTQARVLYTQYEMGMATLRDRMRQTGQEYSNVYVGTTFDMKLDSKVGREKMERAIKEIKPDVVISDPFSKTLGDGDENEVKSVRVVTDFWDEMIETYNCSVINFHHSGKDPSQGARGSSLFGDWHDSVIELKKTSKRGEPLRIRLNPKFLRHAELPPKPIEAELVNFEFQLMDALLTTFQKVREYLEKYGQTTPKDLISVGIGSETSRAPIHEALGRLVKLGLAEKVERGVYRWVK